MRLIYTLGIYLYTLGIRAAALCGHRNARLMVQGWPRGERKVEEGEWVWFHVASLGEFEQARPVLEAYRQRHPDRHMLLSFFSPSGYEVRKNYPLADRVIYLPMDTPRNARQLLDTYHPTIAFFVKYEFWYNYLGQLRGRGIPTYLFSSIFRKEQYFFRHSCRWFLRQLGTCFTHLFVQNEASLQLLTQHGIQHVSIAGDTRFDRVHQIVLADESVPLVEQWLATDAESKVVVAGSSWEPDEALLEQYLQDHRKQLRLILAPHVVSPEHISHIEQTFQCPTVRYSQLAAGRQPEPADRVLIIDSIGILSKLYRYADVAYIGGGFGVGIHNTLEAVAFGKPVLFGPNYRKFQEAVDLLAIGAAWSHSDYPTLADHLSPLLTSTQRLNSASQACLQYMQRNLGSTNKILDTIENS